MPENMKVCKLTFMLHPTSVAQSALNANTVWQSAPHEGHAALTSVLTGSLAVTSGYPSD